MPSQTDLLVIGAGAAGVEAALTAASLGGEVTLVYSGEVGGTCVNNGCVPNNVLLRAAEVYRSQAVAGAGVMDISGAHTSAGKVVERVREGVRRSLVAAGVHMLEGRVSFRSRTTVVVASPTGNVEVGAAKIVIATGASTILPPIADPYSSRVISSADALSLERIPASAIVVLGGHLGLEWATLLHDAGSAVTVVEELPTLRSVADAEVAEYFASQLEAAGLSIFTAAKVAAVSPGADHVTVTLQTPAGTVDKITELVLFADFRTPNTSDLGLEKAGVTLSPDGAVVVDEQLRTSAPGIWAAGDVTGGLMLAAEARVEGRIAAENAYGAGEPMDARLVPRSVHTEPEAASVGLTEAQARERGVDVAVGYAEFAGNARALVLGADRGVVKLVVDAGTEEIYGAAVIGQSAAEIAGLVSLAMQAELTVSDLVRSHHAHPALTELIIDAASAALAAS